MDRYILMNQNTPVLSFYLNKDGFFVIEDVFNAKKLPYALASQVEISGKDIRRWIELRSIPDSRANINKILNEENCKTSYELALKTGAFSLSDPFWVKRESSNICWDSLNFYENGYSEDFGKHLLGISDNASNIISPDISTNGMQKKLWIKENGVDYLLKFGTEPYFQEPANEVTCSRIALTFPHLDAVQYSLTEYNGIKASKCENFIQPGIEFVPAAHIYKKEEDPIGNIYLWLIKKAKELDIYDADKFINEMITFDYIINNIDRNLGNFGFLRDTDTGEFIGTAPLFDSGNSLWFNEKAETILSGQEPAKPFAPTQELQLDYVKNTSIALDELNFFVQKAMNDLAEEIDEERLEKIKINMNKKMDTIEKNYLKNYHRIHLAKLKKEKMRQEEIER